MKVRCINKPADINCSDEVDVPPLATEICVSIPQHRHWSLEEMSPDTVAFKIGTVPIRKMVAPGSGRTWFQADFDEMVVPA